LAKIENTYQPDNPTDTPVYHSDILKSKNRLTFSYFTLFALTILITIGIPLVVQVIQSHQLQSKIQQEQQDRQPIDRIFVVSTWDANEGRFMRLQNALEENRRNSFIATGVITAGSMIAMLVLSYYLAVRSLQPLLQAYSRQQKFIADASHELRTPLTVIKTEAEVLQANKNATPEEYKEFINSTISEVDYLADLSSKLLAMAKLEQAGELKREEVNVNAILTELEEKFTPQIKKKNLTFSLSLPNEEIKLLSDSVIIKQLFTILIDNAVVHNIPNGFINAILKTTKDKEKLIFKITNSSYPISLETLGKLFRPFVTAGESRTEKNHGLGLSIAKQIVEKQGGKIELKAPKNEEFQVKVSLKTS